MTTEVIAQEDALRRAEQEVGDRLLAAGVFDLKVRRRSESGGRMLLRFEFVGRDESGHAQTTHCGFTVAHDGIREEGLAKTIRKACKHHERLAERFLGRPPIAVAPGMPVDHLEVNAPLAARLRDDHGARAVDVVREAVLALAENGRRRSARRRDQQPVMPVPHDMRLNLHRLDHSEELADGVMWRRHSIVMHRTTLPDVIVNGYVGARASEVCDHHILAHPDNRVSAISNATTKTGHTKGTAVLSLVTPWIATEAI